MQTFEPRKIIQDRLAESFGLARYVWLVDRARRCDVSSDEEFQRTFNGFNRVRRGEAWRKAYYDLFEKTKREKLDFAAVLSALYAQTGAVEASFVSKALATLDVDLPVWDRYVVQNVELVLPAANSPNRLQETIHAYQELRRWYDAFLKTKNAKECVKAFDDALPDYAFVSKVKKIDFLLWSKR